MILMLKAILENYLNNVAPKVNMKEEKEIAERHLNYIKANEKPNTENEFEKAN
jgi:hypothetical protein